MKKLFIISLMAATTALATLPALAGDAEAGKAKSAICAACHGPKGISTADIWPNLAGQKKGYLAKQMKAFRDGTRSDPSMDAMMKPLTDADIDNLSAYYSSLPAAP